MAAPPVGIGEVIAGKYIVERVIGEGGMGVVLAARHLELEQRVAIKFLLPEIAQQGMAAERFRREARAAAKMRGEHVCRVLDVGTLESGIPFMVMEYLEGWDLASELERRKLLPVEEAVGYVLEACEALAEAHAAHVIHRDLKPANLFLEARGDGSRRIKVLDFGVSKSLLDATPGLGALTKTSSFVGSPLYMSPEQLESAKDVDVRTDLWALGVVLYELITGQTPFRGETMPQLVASVLHDAPRSLAELACVAPDGLELVLRHALEKPRAQRYSNVAELAQDLVPYAAAGGATNAARVQRLLSAEPSVNSVLRSAAPKLVTPNTPSKTNTSTPLSWDQHATAKDTRRRWRAIGIAVALVLSGIGFFLYRQSHGVIDGDAPAQLTPASAATPVANLPKPADQPAATLEPRDQKPIAPPADPETATPSGLSEPPAARETPTPPSDQQPELRPNEPKPSLPPRAATLGTRAHAESPAAVRSKPELPAPTSISPVRPAANAAPNNLSDFGGRR
jgi:serine/threonine protein kinase